MLIKSAFADSSTDARIQAYKANKLIPQEITLPTSTGAKDSDEVVVFNSNALAWNSQNAGVVALAPLLEKYGDWSNEDFQTLFSNPGEYNYDSWEWDNGWLTGYLNGEESQSEIDEAREYLSLIARGLLSSDKLSASDAKAELQRQLDVMCEDVGDHEGPYFGSFPFYGLSLENKVIYRTDLTNTQGLTGSQITSLSGLTDTILPAVHFSETDSFANFDSLGNVDFSKCTGLTGAHIAECDDWTACTLPPITFSGNEDLSQVRLNWVDLSKSSGLTVDQVINAYSLYHTTLPAINFTGTEDLTPTGSADKWEGTNFTACTGITGTQYLNYLHNSYDTCFSSISFNGTEDFSGVDLSSKDVTSFKGVTGSQISKATSIDGMQLTSEQYETWKDDLNAKFSGSTIYVDWDNEVTIP